MDGVESANVCIVRCSIYSCAPVSTKSFNIINIDVVKHDCPYEEYSKADCVCGSIPVHRLQFGENLVMDKYYGIVGNFCGVVEHWTTNTTNEATLPTFTCNASSNHELLLKNIFTPENYPLYTVCAWLLSQQYSFHQL